MDEANEISTRTNNTINYIGTYGNRNKSETVKDLKNKLYLKLKKYHPELTFECASKQQNQEQSFEQYNDPWRSYK